MSLFKVTLGGLGLVALSACFAACGDDDQDEGKPDSSDTGGSSSSGGKTGSGGDTEAGAGGTSSGGSSNGGATEAGPGGSTGEGGPGPADGGGAGGGDGAIGDGGGIAIAKFCNEVALGSGASQQSVTFQVVIGTGANAVTLEAATGTCSSAVDLPCTQFPAGTGITVTLLDKSNTSKPLETREIDAVDGETWIFGATITTEAPIRPTLFGEDPEQGATCSSTDYDDVFPPNLQASSNVASASGYSTFR